MCTQNENWPQVDFDELIYLETLYKINSIKKKCGQIITSKCDNDLLSSQDITFYSM